MANRTVSVVLQAQIGQYVSNMTKAAAATKGVGETADATGKKSRGGFDIAGKGALLMGGAIVTGLGAAISKSMDFEKSMSGVQAATQASAATLGDLREAAMQAGADTQYSATEAADAITEMSKAGVAAGDIMGGGLTGALSLAAAGQLEVADAAGIASTAMTQFNLSGEDLPHVADLLAAGAGKAMGSVEDLGMALNQAGLVASATGLSIEETTGTLSAFASAGLIGSDAGTSLKSMLQQLQNPSKQSAALMEQYGISLYDASGNVVGMAGVAGQLQAAFGNLTPAVRDQAMAQIFGSDAVRAANVLYSEGADGITDWTGKVNDAGYAQEQAAALTDNLAGDLERLGGSFDTLLISLGSGTQGPLRELVQMLGGLVDGVTGAVSAFSSMPGPMQLAIVAALGWAAAGGKIMEILKPMGGALGGLRGGWQSFGEALSYARANGDGLGTVLKSVGDYAGGQALSGVKALATAIGPELGIGAATLLIGSAIQTIELLGHAGETAAEEIKGIDRSLRDIDSNDARIKATGDAIQDLRDKLADAQEVKFGDTDWGNALGGFSFQLSAFAAAAGDGEAAAKAYRDAIADLEHQQEATSATAAALAAEWGVSTGTVVTLADKYGVDLSQGAAGAQAAIEGAQAAEAGQSDGAIVASDSTAGYAAQLEEAAAAADAAKKQTDAFKLSLDILTGAQVSLATVEAAYYAALNDVTGATEGLSGAVVTASGDFDRQTEAGQGAQAALFNLREGSHDFIATLLEQGVATGDVIAKDDELRQNFYDSALQLTHNADAAKYLTDRYYGIPSDRHTAITADAAQAGSTIGQVKGWLGSITDKAITLTVSADVSAARRSIANLSAGLIRIPDFASGGYTGAGGRYEPAGIVHRGEVVVPKPIVDRRGVSNIYAAVGMKGYVDGGFVTPASREVPGYAASATRGSGGPVNVAAPQVKVYLDGQEWRGIARVEVDNALGSMADQQLYAGT